MAIDGVLNSAYDSSLTVSTSQGNPAVASQETPVVSGNSSTGQQKAAELPASKLQQMIQTWKGQSIQPNLSVQFDKNEPTNQIWLNLIDNTTGEVIMKLPPEAIRMMIQHNQASGLMTDVQT